MMGLSFNGVGKYVGWSSLFDYSSLEALEASEYLPMPNRTEFQKNDLEGYNIDNYIDKLNSCYIKDNDGKYKLVNRIKRIQTYVELLNYLNDNNISEVTWSKEKESVEDVLEKLNRHEKTKIPNNLKEQAFKNFISSHIQNTIQNFTNFIGAYTPIEMEDLRNASLISTKGEQSKRMTLLNPAVKYLMQYENITGKNVIGISATGIKASFSWHYYLNEILQNNINGSNNELIERAKFSFVTSRIKGRFDATDKTTHELDPNYNGYFDNRSLPNINWNNVSEETKKLLLEFDNRGSVDENVLIAKLTVDLMQSQVLSAATDSKNFKLQIKF